MNLLKILVCVATLLAAGQNAYAVGKMERDEVRDGQLVCMGNQAKASRPIASQQSSSVTSEGQPADAARAN